MRPYKAKFTVVNDSTVNITKMVDTVPRCYIFNSSGELVDSTTPKKARPFLVKLVRTEPHWLAAGREYQKLGKIAYALKKSRGYGPIIKRLEKEAEKGDEYEEEADYLLDRIRGYGGRMLKKAESLESEDALTSYELYGEVSSLFKGDEIGDKAGSRLEELKDNETFQAELKASKIARIISEELSGVSFASGGVLRYDSGENRRIAAKVRQLCMLLEKKYPDSKALENVEKLLKEYEL
jgi:hypothetical protein